MHNYAVENYEVENFIEKIKAEKKEQEKRVDKVEVPKIWAEIEREVQRCDHTDNESRVKKLSSKTDRTVNTMK